VSLFDGLLFMCSQRAQQPTCPQSSPRSQALLGNALTRSSASRTRRSVRMLKCMQVFLTSACYLVMLSLGCDSPRDIPSNNSSASAVQKTAAASFPVDSSLESALEPDASSTRVSTCSLPLRVHITGFKKNTGTCRVALYCSPDHFNDPEHALAKASLEIVDSHAQWNVKLDLPLAQRVNTDSLEFNISLSAYHDEHENSKLDKSSFGIPTELYGFSQNPKRGFGPPKFKETAILIAFDKETLRPLDMQEIAIQIK